MRRPGSRHPPTVDEGDMDSSNERYTTTRTSLFDLKTRELLVGLFPPSFAFVPPGTPPY